jgi:hypothetical protein
MLEIVELIEKETIKSIKSKNDPLRVMTLRMIKNSIKNYEISIYGKSELKLEDVYDILSKMVKQRKDSSEQFKNAGRIDLYEKETKEIEIISEFLPKQMNVNELDSLIVDVMSMVGYNMGLVMKKLLPLTKGKIDGKIVSERVKFYIGGK